MRKAIILACLFLIGCETTHQSQKSEDQMIDEIQYMLESHQQAVWVMVSTDLDIEYVWEYRVETLPYGYNGIINAYETENIRNHLNDFGRKGWMVMGYWGGQRNNVGSKGPETIVILGRIKKLKIK